jgi:hypothetical protein
MDAAQLVLEYIKALAWPVVVLALLLKFRPAVEGLLHEFSGRLRSAKSVKLGIFGQEVELSGTAKELMREREKLLQDRAAGTAAIKKAERIGRSVDSLANPMSDTIGLVLLTAKATGVPIEQIMKDVWMMISPGQEKKKPIVPPMFLLNLSREIEKILAELVNLGLVSLKGEEYRLTSDGRDLFTKVRDEQNQLFQKFDKLWEQ